MMHGLINSLLIMTLLKLHWLHVMPNEEGEMTVVWLRIGTRQSLLSEYAIPITGWTTEESEFKSR
jgi:hypothetical protein